VNSFPVLELLAFRRAKAMAENPHYARAFENDLTDKIYNEIRTRMLHNLNFIVEIIGETGSGKSEAGFHLNWRCQRELGYDFLTRDNYAFTFTEAQNIVKKYNDKWTIQIDEQVRNYFGEGARKELASMQDLEDTQRANQINFIFVSPTTRPFHTGLHYILRTWMIDYVQQTNYLLIFEPTDTTLKMPLGYVAVSRLKSPQYLHFLTEYQKYKKEFNSLVKNKGTRVMYYEEKVKDAERIVEVLQKSGIKNNKKNILAFITMKLPEYASKYTIKELSSVADIVKILMDEKGKGI